MRNFALSRRLRDRSQEADRRNDGHGFAGLREDTVERTGIFAAGTVSEFNDEPGIGANRGDDGGTVGRGELHGAADAQHFQLITAI